MLFKKYSISWTIDLNRTRIYDHDKFPDLFTDRQVRVFQLKDKKICIAKFKEEYFAFEQLCPHQKHPLNESVVTPFGEVVCPLHEYRFSLMYGEEAYDKCRPLKRYELFMNPEGVYLEF